MSKLNSDKITYNENDFLVEVSESDAPKNQLSQEELLINRVQNEAESELEKAHQKALEIIEHAKSDAHNKASEIINNAQNEANTLIEQAKKQAEDLLEEAKTNKNEILTNAQSEIERSSQEAAIRGYEEGYQDAQNKFFEENEEKIKGFDEFCQNQNIVRDKILKNASREILNIIQNISNCVLLKELDPETLEKIIKNTITLFDKKENITIVLSEKYAKLLFELQQKQSDIELNFNDFKQYEGFNVVYNKELAPDTIIVENLKERFDSSIISQLDKIIRNIQDNTQGNLDLEEYDETSTAE